MRGQRVEAQASKGGGGAVLSSRQLGSVSWAEMMSKEPLELLLLASPRPMLMSAACSRGRARCSGVCSTLSPLKVYATVWLSWGAPCAKMAGWTVPLHATALL